MAFLSLRQKVYICICTHFDISKIYESKETGQLLLWIWKTKLNEWINDGTRSLTSTEFSVLVLITFLLNIDILGLAMLIQLYGDEGQVNFFKHCSWSVFVFAWHLLSWTTTHEFFFATAL